MVYLLIKQPIKDFVIWKNAFDKFWEYRKICGELSCEIYQTKDNENELFILSEWISIENLRDFLESQTFQMIKELEEKEPIPIQFLQKSAVGELN